MMRLLMLILAIVTVVGESHAQGDTIRLTNPSFEDDPKQGGSGTNGIKGWFDCGVINFTSETPPDIHPNGYWENNLPASDKKTYLGMVVRDNNTYESVSQRLDQPLEAGKCYKFSIHLAKAPKYISQTRTTGDYDNYITPVVLRIWGGSGFCNERELLGESEAVQNTSWQINNFEFNPQNNIRCITFSAYYKTPVFVPYNGNLLLDGASDIIRIPCPGEVSFNQKQQKLPPHKRKKNNVDQVAKSNKKEDTEAASPPKPYKPKILQELSRNTIKEGQTIEIKKLLFKADSSGFDKSSFEVLEDVYGFLISNQDVVIEIGGHTNGVPSDEYCNKLSTSRAKAVAEYLVAKGINPSKVQFKGYGKKQPIADNKTKEGRDKNQRVEIKILSLDS